MFHRWIKVTLVVCLVAVAFGITSQGLRAYSTFGKWATASVPIYVNPQNADVSSSAAEAAVQAGMNVWNSQANANFKYVYAGRVGDTTTGYDNRNVVIFRDASNGAAIASTYSWSVGDQIVDADVIFWDQAFTFFTGTSGCSGGAYIEDVATHELGHALGLLHSDDPSATMYAVYPYCSQELRTLATDDISGIQSLYGTGTGTRIANSAPTVTISSPANGSSYSDGAVISFTGLASDAQDGDLSSALAWTSSIDGAIGTGSAFSRLLSVGTHVITAAATDRGGLSGSTSVSITVAAAPSTATATPSLSATGSRTKRQLKVSLSWSGFGASMLDVYRNGGLVYTTANDGSQIDTMKGASGTFVYQICASATAVCSNQASVTF